MFGRTRDRAATVPVAAPAGRAASRTGAAPNIVAEGAVFRADLTVEGSLLVQGTVVGNVRVTGSVYVARGAIVEGNVEAEEARIEGRVQGDVKARESVDLLPGSKLHGDVYTRCLRIEEGAILRGTSFMGDSWVDD